MFKYLLSKLSSQLTMTKNYVGNVKRKIIGSNLSGEDISYIEELHKILYLQDLADPRFHFKRIGSKRDGGYVMVDPVSTNKIAYSIGICDNVDWDADMVNNGYVVFMYDHTIDRLPIEKKGFHWVKQGICGGGIKGDLRPLIHMLQDNGHTSASGMVFKMDVEGYEWEVLDDISENILEQFDQIVLEIHFLLTSSNREQMLRCLKKLSCSHNLVHIHANSTCKIIYYKNMIMPDVLEVTYIKKDFCKLKKMEKMLPRKEDKASTIRLPEIKLGMWN